MRAEENTEDLLRALKSDADTVQALEGKRLGVSEPHASSARHRKIMSFFILGVLPISLAGLMVFFLATRAPMLLLLLILLYGLELLLFIVFSFDLSSVVKGSLVFKASMVDMRSRGLTEISRDVWKYGHLKILRLSHNRIAHLPPEIGELEDLEELDLSDNQLTHLPPEIGKLKNLEELDLSDNQLTHLPPEIGKLKKLKYLHLGGNPLPRSEKDKIKKLLPECRIYWL
jgi:hypothetical protein